MGLFERIIGILPFWSDLPKEDDRIKELLQRANLPDNTINHNLMHYLPGGNIQELYIKFLSREIPPKPTTRHISNPRWRRYRERLMREYG